MSWGTVTIVSWSLALASLGGAAQSVAPVRPLDGQYVGAITTIRHPRGWFSFEVPHTWSVATHDDGAMVINPGLTATGTLDARVVVTYGELDAAQAGRDAAALFPDVRSSIVQALAAQSIAVSDTAAAPRAVQLAHALGVVQEWSGRADGRDVRVFFGALVRDAAYLAVTAVVATGQEDRFLPGVKRLLHTVIPRLPARNFAAEQALAGLEFSAIETRPGGARGSFSAMFAFGAGGRVKKTLMMSGMVGLSSSIGGDSEEWGTYEVIGDDVTLAFRDSADTLRLIVDQGRITALERDGRRYRRR
jgi:hypothetical protein